MASSRCIFSKNVRELENFIERGVILSRGTELQIPLAELKQRTKDATARPFRRFCVAGKRGTEAHCACAQRNQLGNRRTHGCGCQARHETDDSSVAND